MNDKKNGNGDAKKNGNGDAKKTETLAASDVKTVPATEVTNLLAPNSPEAKSLFVAFGKAVQAHNKVKGTIDAADMAVSDAIKAISEKVGNGPFNIDGQKKSISNRNGRYFFRAHEEMTFPTVSTTE